MNLILDGFDIDLLILPWNYLIMEIILELICPSQAAACDSHWTQTLLNLTLKLMQCVVSF